MPGLLSRLLAALPTPARPAPELIEKRRAGATVFADFGAGPISGIGSFVNVRMAENVAAVVACVNAIAGPISSVPAKVFRTIEGGREEAPTHPVSRLIEAPNARQTWPDWVQFTLGQYLTHGNSISLIERDGAGRPIALVPLPWQGIQVQLLQSGRLAFDTMMQTFPWSSTGTPLRRLFEDEVFWLKGRTDDGYLGRSVLARAPAVLKAALGIQEMTSTLWDNAAIPSGIIKHPGVLSSEAKTQIGESFAHTFQGAKNAGKVPVFEEGMTFEPTSMSPEDNEVLMSRRFSGEEIFRLFGVQPPLAGDLSHGSFTNMETAGRWHSSLCLAVHCRAIEAEFQRSLFTPDSDCHLMIDLSGLQRGDDAARWQTYALAIENGILTVNEVRKIEGFNPQAGGDQLRPGGKSGSPAPVATEAPA